MKINPTYTPGYTRWAKDIKDIEPSIREIANGFMAFHESMPYDTYCFGVTAKEAIANFKAHMEELAGKEVKVREIGA